MASDLLSYRSRFPILAETTYLVSHSLGAMSTDTAEALNRYAETWSTRGVRAWSEGWWETPISVGDTLAPIVGAAPGTIAMVQNVAVAQQVIASCFSFTAPQNRVVYTELNFPSVMYLWEGVPGTEVRMVRSWDGITVPTETLLDAIDERTAVVPISHVLFRSAYIQDAEAIVARAHEVGAMVVLDCYQSAGALPFSLTDLGVDFAVGGSVKWLCGGPGAGWIYVRSDLQHLRPRFVGWQADRDPFGFRPGRIDHADGMWRFLSGTPAVPALLGAEAGYRIVAEVGVERIRDRSLEMTGRLLDIADEIGIPVGTPREAEQRGGTVTFQVDEEARVAAALIDEEIIVDARPGSGVRVGPHFYNSDDDIERFGEALARIVAH